MFFQKKNIKCDNCNTKIKKKYSYCPYCGVSLINEEKYSKDYGLLGKGEEFNEENMNPSFGIGITDKLIGSLMNNLMKSLDKQFKNIDKEFNKTEIRNFPNGIRIQIGQPANIKKTQRKNFFEKQISDMQLKKINSFPKEKAETKMKRLHDKIIYELNAPGIESPQDVFISKIESGYEIKAIGNKKVYVNSLPINLPLKGLSLNEDKILVEFKTFNN